MYPGRLGRCTYPGSMATMGRRAYIHQGIPHPREPRRLLFTVIPHPKEPRRLLFTVIPSLLRVLRGIYQGVPRGVRRKVYLQGCT